MGIEAFGLSMKGRGREVNQDQFVVATLKKQLEVNTSTIDPDVMGFTENLSSHFLAVADGVGGMDCGEKASGLAAEVITGYMQRTMPWFLTRRPDLRLDPESELTRAVATCNGALTAYAEERGVHMATTLTLAYVTGRSLFLAHVGDSRCYRVRDHSIERLTRDQTLAQQMVDEGELTETEAAKSPLSAVLTSALGSHDTRLAIDFRRESLREDDRLLLCSDGLTKVLSDNEILDVLLDEPDLEELCRKLVASGHAPDRSDDTTVIVAEFHDDVRRRRGAASP